MSRSANLRWRARLATPGEGAGLLYLAPQYATVGQEKELYLDNILVADGDSGDLATDYTWTVACEAGGTVTGTVWKLTPSTAGLWPITVRQYNAAGTQVGSASSTLQVFEETVTTPVVATVGDSLTGRGKWQAALETLLPNATLVGTLGPTNGVLHDGVGGSSAYTWTTSDDMPISDGYDAWVEDLGAVPDVVVLMLGINRVVQDGTAVVADEIARMETMVQGFLGAGCGAVVVALTTPGNSDQAAWTDNYPGQPYESQYRWEQIQRSQYRDQVAQWIDRGAERIFLANAETWIDPIDGYPGAPDWNAVHPDVSGYAQIAAAVYTAIQRT